MSQIGVSRKRGEFHAIHYAMDILQLLLRPLEALSIFRNTTDCTAPSCYDQILASRDLLVEPCLSCFFG